MGRNKLDFSKRKALYDQGLTDTQIAEVLGVSRTTVGCWRNRLNLPVNIGPRKPRKNNNPQGVPARKVLPTNGCLLCFMFFRDINIGYSRNPKKFNIGTALENWRMQYGGKII